MNVKKIRKKMKHLKADNVDFDALVDVVISLKDGKKSLKNCKRDEFDALIERVDDVLKLFFDPSKSLNEIRCSSHLSNSIYSVEYKKIDTIYKASYPEYYDKSLNKIRFENSTVSVADVRKMLDKYPDDMVFMVGDDIPMKKLVMKNVKLEKLMQIEEFKEYPYGNKEKKLVKVLTLE